MFSKPSPLLLMRSVPVGFANVCVAKVPFPLLI
jgi:hypothetical protein